MKNSIVADKSYSFALEIIKTYKFLVTDKKEFVLSKQLLRSCTAIGALVREAEHAQSRRDFLSKMNIALKEANETLYWVLLLHDSEILNTDQFGMLKFSSEELVKILASIVKTTKAKIAN